MRKLFLMASFILATLFASAQFMVVTTIDMPEDDAEWEMSNITDNIGVGYQLGNITIGAVKNGDNYDLFGRYQLKMGYLSVQAPTEEMADNLKLGVGYSLKIWNELYIEPNYSMPVKEDAEGNREGEFKLGISYRL